jgi:hypothetical protein
MYKRLIPLSKVNLNKLMKKIAIDFEVWKNTLLLPCF